MRLSRRWILKGAGTLPLLAGSFGLPLFGLRARAQTAPEVSAPAAVPPILFVHGNGDHAALWITTVWRMESNGVPRERMLATNFADPLARTDDKVEQANRSSTEDQRRELGEAVKELQRRTGAVRIALVGNSRGGYSIRNTIRNGGGADISHAVLCGVPNHGIYDWDDGPGGEFNGRGPFLRGLNEGESEVTPGTAFLTLRSDGNDKYAQPDGRFVGKPGTPTGITAEGPALRGATNLVLGQLDHRELAFHPRAVREIYKFISGNEPERLGIVPEPIVTLDGLVTGFPAGVATNRPLAGATVEVYRVSPDSGARLGAPVHRRVTGPDGAWGPVTVEPGWFLEFVVEAPAHPTTHLYRSPFPRSSSVVRLRPGRPLGDKDSGAGAVVLMSRPRGYFGIPRDVVLLDGKEPKDVTAGVPTDSVSTLRLPAGEAARPIAALFNEERIVARGWPAAENRIAIAEFTY